jgi:hypothetical protein
MPADISILIRTMAEANPRWGAPRIHGELLTLGIDVYQATVAKLHKCRRPRPPDVARSERRRQIVAAISSSSRP